VKNTTLSLRKQFLFNFIKCKPAGELVVFGGKEIEIMKLGKIFTGLAAAGLMLSTSVLPAFADSVGSDFENPPYVLGNINGQDGWMKTGGYDAEVVSNTFGFSDFAAQSLRISNAVTSGSFGDQTFAKPLVDSVGEIDSTNGAFSPGTKKTHYELQFDIASTMPTQQPGLSMSVSPDRGDGSRMSYLRFEDGVSGINVFFYDVQGVTNPANFVQTQIATDLSRAAKHTIKLTFDALDGPSNDVVKVWIDGILVKTGTSWENYYRYDSESFAEQTPRIVKTAIFRAAGTAAPANLGKGFLVDNLSLLSLSPVLPSVPEILSPANGSSVTTADLVKIDWTDSVGGTYPPFEYQYQAFSDSGYTNSVYLSSWLTNSEIPTPGTPVGDYYLRVRAKDANGSETAWSNGFGSEYKITVIANPTATPTPIPLTNKEQCKNGGWAAFLFKNQGECVSSVTANPKSGK
jgi:hypothetical protein